MALVRLVCFGVYPPLLAGSIPEIPPSDAVQDPPQLARFSRNSHNAPSSTAASRGRLRLIPSRKSQGKGPAQFNAVPLRDLYRTAREPQLDAQAGELASRLGVKGKVVEGSEGLFTHSGDPQTRLSSSKVSSTANPFFSDTMAPNSRCGLPLPLPVDFDTTAHMTRPADIPATPGFDLGDINAENLRLEKLMNKISIAYTRAFAAARASPTGINNLDVGAMLELFLAYSDADKELLVGSEAVVAATGPLPTYMTLWVAGVRIAEAQKNQKEKARRDKEKSDVIAAKTALPIFGTLEMVNPQVVGGTLSSVTSIPVLWHSSRFYKVYFPLRWWSHDATLERATN
ncbi:hypothetical protein C8R46DRAFT_1027698 [Mycena filopes]|nr:hypothetical protein C8R46DRAFT_1027698 [Mycena filopes]